MREHILRNYFYANSTVYFRSRKRRYQRKVVGIEIELMFSEDEARAVQLMEDIAVERQKRRCTYHDLT